MNRSGRSELHASVQLLSAWVIFTSFFSRVLAYASSILLIDCIYRWKGGTTPGRLDEKSAKAHWLVLDLRSEVRQILTLLGVTSAMISAMKGVKMAGLTNKLMAIIQTLRIEEVTSAIRFRMMIVAFVFTCRHPAPHRVIAGTDSTSFCSSVHKPNSHVRNIRCYWQGNSWNRHHVHINHPHLTHYESSGPSFSTNTRYDGCNPVPAKSPSFPSNGKQIRPSAHFAAR